MDVLQPILAVLFVLGLLCTALWIFRRKGWATGAAPIRRRRDLPKQLEVIDGLTLTPHHSLHLVRLADRVLLVGLSPQGCSLLDTQKSVPGAEA
jgi:flagellar biogenesis protein FliO